MTIEIHEPELERMIEQRMASGAYGSVDDVLLQALRATPSMSLTDLQASSAKKMGTSLLESLQRCPYPEVDLEPARPQMEVKEFSW